VAAAHAVHRWKAEVYIACYEEIIRRGWQKIPFREKVSVAIVLWGLRANADLDNAFKSIADALNGCAYYDDSQIAKLTVERRPADKAHPPGAIIEIEEIA
jgi:Holliday junction resolvase RusA-like endonuclease